MDKSLLFSVGLIAGLSLISCEVTINDSKDEPVESVSSYSLSDEYADAVNQMRDDLKYEEALSYIDSLLEKSPGDLILLKDRGIIKSDLGDYSGAKEDYLAVIEKDTTFSEAYVNLGHSYMLEGNLEKAKEMTAKGLELDPSSSMAHLNMGVFNMREQGEVIDSYHHFKKAIELDPENSMAYNNIGYLHMINGGNDSAYFYYQKALDLNPNNVTALNNRVGLNISEDKQQAVLDDLLHIYKLTPEDNSVPSSICFAYYSLGNIEKSLDWGELATSSDPESVQAAINYGYALMADGQVEEACEQFHRFEFSPGEELLDIMKPCKEIANN